MMTEDDLREWMKRNNWDTYQAKTVLMCSDNMIRCYLKSEHKITPLKEHLCRSVDLLRALKAGTDQISYQTACRIHADLVERMKIADKNPGKRKLRAMMWERRNKRLAWAKRWKKTNQENVAHE